MTERAVWRGQQGFVLGSEGLLFGTLILLAGTLLLVNAWAVIDTRMAVDSAAREYLRSYTEAASADTAVHSGARAAHETLTERGTALRSLTIEDPDIASFGPCQLATVTLAVTVPAVRLPFIAGIGATVVRVTHSELVDAHREMTVGDGYDPTTVPCDGL